ncbi:MAG: hypothetical protein LBV28_03370 [Puniceicoccales bacterium]|jgi:hypothetical protein|nr:hypothetical protein [Puniceicoccales bacterium]
MKTWRYMEIALRTLGLERGETRRLRTTEGVLRITAFRLPADGTDCFRRIESGCWCAGVPSTGTLRALLRAAGLSDTGGLHLPGEGAARQAGFLAVDTEVPRAGRFWRIRLWWIDGRMPFAFRLSGLFRSELFLNMKPC